MRVGDYRVIADIDVKKRLVEIRHIDHMKNIYKSLP
jgi:mRNA-degrading endonuclease RelE of RelBE toxin-antitoxin system